MFSTLKKLGHKRKFHRKDKGKKNLEMLSSDDKMKSTAKSSFDLCGDPMPPFNPARRHSCFSAFLDMPTEMLRRGSNASQASSCSAGSKCRRGSAASATSNGASAESHRVKRLEEIAQLDRYVENLKKSADPDNMSHIPNRLCVALLLKSVLQRRERQYMYEYLHSNRCSSDSDVSMKGRRDSPNLNRGPSTTLSDVNNNNSRSSSSIDKRNSTAGDKEKVCQCHLQRSSQDVEWKREDSSPHLHSDNIDTSEEEKEESSDDSRDETQEERVPGALLKAYQLELSEHSAGSDSEVLEVSKHHRYRKRCNSKTKRKSISLFPSNYEIY